MGKSIFYVLFILNIIILFFQGFIFKIGSIFIPCYTCTILLLYFVYAAFKPKSLLLKIKQLYLHTPFKFYALFIIWLFIDALILIFLNKANFLIFYYIIVKLLPPFLLTYLLSAIFIPKYLSIQKLIKIFVSIFSFACIIGLIGFIGDLLHITALSSIVNFFSNAKYIMQNVEIMTDDISGLPRLRSLFPEPGTFANFIFLVLPIIYNVCLSKYKIFKNKTINIFTKKSLIPLTWLCLILTMSPIYVIFSGILTIIYFYKKIIKYIIKHSILTITVLLLFIFFVFVIITHNSDIIQKTFLARIINVFHAHNMEDLILTEGSLATRIISYINTYILFTKSIFIGFGYDNARYFMYNQFMHSPVPLNREIMYNLKNAIETGTGCAYGKSLLSGLLVETGLIGTFLYTKFLFNNLKTIKKINLSFSGTEKNFINGIKMSIIALIITAFYTPTFSMPFMCFLYGLVCSYKTQYIVLSKGMKNKNE